MVLFSDSFYLDTFMGVFEIIVVLERELRMVLIYSFKFGNGHMKASGSEFDEGFFKDET